jgi:hypothetical protein
VTTPLLTEHSGPVVEVIVGVTPEFSVVATVKVDKYAALDGPPVKVTSGAIFSAVVVAVAVPAA